MGRLKQSSLLRVTSSWNPALAKGSSDWNDRLPSPPVPQLSSAPQT